MRKENEPLMLFWWRQFCERPSGVIAFGCMVAVCYLHIQQRADYECHRLYMEKQNAAQVECIREFTKYVGEVNAQLQEVNNRLGHLEREHEHQRQK